MTDDGVRIYPEYTGWMTQVKSVITLKAMFYILSIYNGYNCVVTFVPAVRKKMMKECGLTYAALRKAIHELMGYEALLPYTFENPITGEPGIDKDKYIVNPYMFWKLTSEERELFLSKGKVDKV